MATVIRFSRHGTKKRPFFRIVVQDHRRPRDGKFIEHIGSFEPIKGPSTLTIERDRLSYWLSVGAQLSDSVRTAVSGVLKELRGTTTPATPQAPAAPAKKPKKTAAPKEA